MNSSSYNQSQIFSSFGSNQTQVKSFVHQMIQNKRELPSNLKQKKLVHNTNIIKWLKKRYQNSAKSEYLMNKDQIQKEQEMTDVFKKFDYDKSGTIELEELHKMFNDYGIEVEKHELKALFKIVDTDGSGKLSLEEFKQFTTNPMANKVFKQIMKRLRDEQERFYGKGKIQGYLPFNLNRLLDHLSVMSKRENIVENIENTKYQHDSAQTNIRNFIKLFILDGSAKDSLTVDEPAKRLNDNKIRTTKRIQFVKQDTMAKASEKLQSLDDEMLDTLTERVIKHQNKLRKQPLYKNSNVYVDKNDLDKISEDSFQSDNSSSDSDNDDKENQKDLQNGTYNGQLKSIHDIIVEAKNRGKELAYKEYILRSSKDSRNTNQGLCQTRDHSRQQSSSSRIIPQRKNNSQKRFQSQDQNFFIAPTQEISTLYSTQGAFQNITTNINITGNNIQVQNLTTNKQKVSFQNHPKTANFSKQSEVLKSFQPKSSISNEMKLPGIMKTKQVRYDAITEKYTHMKNLIETQRKQAFVRNE